MKYRHVIWDFDGTLFDSYPAMAEAFRLTLSELGVEERADAVMEMMKVSMGHAEAHYRDKYALGGAAFERFAVHKGPAEEAGVRPFDGAAALCRDICLAGGKNYMFTHRGASALVFLEKYGLVGHFADVVTSTLGFARKPSPDALLYLMEKHGFSGGDAVMVGDRDMDMLSALNAGVHTCFFSGNGGRTEVAEASAASFDELRSVLEV